MANNYFGVELSGFGKYRAKKQKARCDKKITTNPISLKKQEALYGFLALFMKAEQREIINTQPFEYKHKIQTLTGEYGPDERSPLYNFVYPQEMKIKK